MHYDNTLYIIGNGFDLYHGANSSFSHFKEYVKRKKYGLFMELESFFMPHDLWSNFEANLALLNRTIPLYAAEFMKPDPKKDFDDLKIADIIMPGDFAGGMLDELLKNIRMVFHRWILTVKLHHSNLNAKLWINDYARFINFNYTNFLESIYGIERERINYIHGYYLNKMGSLIVGHSTSHDKLFADWIESIKPEYDRMYINKKGKKYNKRDILYNAYLNEDYHDPIIEIAVERIEGYFGDSLKDSDQIVKDNKEFFEQLGGIKYVYVLGHAISPVDARYYYEIINQNKDSSAIKWVVTYHNNNAKETLSNNLIRLGVKNKQIEMIAWSELERD